jgi:hypothetical protein
MFTHLGFASTSGGSVDHSMGFLDRLRLVLPESSFLDRGFNAGVFAAHQPG